MENSEERTCLAKTRRELAEKNGKRYREAFLYMKDERKKTLELMRRRHAYYTKLIADEEIKTAEIFYESYRDLFLMYGVELTLSDDKSSCSIYLELGDYDYENYLVEDGKEDGLAEMCPEVSFKELFHNLTVNIFTEEET